MTFSGGQFTVDASGAGQDATLQASGTGNANVNSVGGGNVNIATSTGNVVVTSTSGNVQVGPSMTVGGASAPNSTLDVRGSLQLPVVFTGAANYNVTATDYAVIANNGAAAITVTLPAAAANLAGRTYAIKADVNNAGGVTVNTAGGNIDGIATYVLVGANNSIVVICDGTNWQVLSNQ
jgi:hypothetical protein